MKEKENKKLQQMQERYEQVNRLLTSPEVLQNPDLLQKYSKERKELERILQWWEEYQKLKEEMDNVQTMLEEEKEEELRELAGQEKEELETKISALEDKINFALLPTDKFSHRNAMVEIRAGAGGDEAALFAAELYKMYTSFCESKGWKIENIHYHPTELGGLREVVFMVEGKDSFSVLRYESGVHRVQRVPVTESSGRIHTSTVTVAVLPEAEEVDEVKINSEDLRVDTFHSSGAGGQHVNVTDSAVRITHLPTGIVVQCQDERSQHQNRAKAMRVLRAKLLDEKEKERERKRSKERKAQIGRGERSERIRTYNFPQGRVTDHRINFTLYNLEEILNGELGELINPLMRRMKERELVSD